MNTTRLILSALVLCPGSFVLAQTAPVESADDALRPIAYLNGVTQQGLSTETAELARSITALMGELQRNGFPEQSLDGLKQLVAQLGTLGGDDMAAIADRLRGLGEDPGLDAREAVTAAYVAQQAIEARLKALAKKIAVRQLREETVRRLETLIARQLATQRETKSIVNVASPGTRQQLLATDQRGIGDDLEGFFQTGETLLSNLRESSGAATAEAAGASFTERINGALLNTYSSEALDLIEHAKYADAHVRQNLLLAELNRILQGILSSQTKEERLASALMQVSALRQEQEARDKSDKETNPEEAQAAADEAKLLTAKVAAVDKEAAKAVDEAQKVLQKEADAAAEKAKNPATPEKTSPASKTAKAESEAKTPEAGETPKVAAAKDPAAKPESSKEQAAQPAAAEAGQQAAAAEPGAKPEAAEPGEAAGEQTAEAKSTGEKGEDKKGEGEKTAGQTPAPSEASTALAAAEAALRKELSTEQAKETAAKQLAAGKNQPGQPNQPGQAQPPSTSQKPGQKSNDGKSSQGGEDSGLVANQGATGTEGPAQSVGALNRAEREAMASLQNERYPAEYAPWVQQYWRNLAQEK